MPAKSYGALQAIRGHGPLLQRQLQPEFHVRIRGTPKTVR